MKRHCLAAIAAALGLLLIFALTDSARAQVVGSDATPGGTPRVPLGTPDVDGVGRAGLRPGEPVRVGPNRFTKKVDGRDQIIGAATVGLTVRGSRMIGMDVRDTTGASLGKVHDFVTDDFGSIRYVTVGFQGVGFNSSQWYAIPYRALELQRSDEGGVYIQLDKSRGQLERAPAFSSREWPDFTDKVFVTSVDRYWLGGTVGGTGNFGGAGSTSGPAVNPRGVGGTGNIGGAGSTSGPAPVPRGVGGTGDFGGAGSTAGPGRPSQISDKGGAGRGVSGSSGTPGGTIRNPRPR